jgi:hypothetical protein
MRTAGDSGPQIKCTRRGDETASAWRSSGEVENQTENDLTRADTGAAHGVGWKWVVEPENKSSDRREHVRSTMTIAFFKPLLI